MIRVAGNNERYRVLIFSPSSLTRAPLHSETSLEQLGVPAIGLTEESSIMFVR